MQLARALWLLRLALDGDALCADDAASLWGREEDSDCASAELLLRALRGAQWSAVLERAAYEAEPLLQRVAASPRATDKALTLALCARVSFHSLGRVVRESRAFSVRTPVFGGGVCVEAVRLSSEREHPPFRLAFADTCASQLEEASKERESRPFPKLEFRS